MRMHKSPPAVGSVDINQKGKYLLNSQTVNDLQTRSSYQFDGVNDIVTAGAGTLGSVDITISVWVKPTDTSSPSTQGIVTNGTTAATRRDLQISTDQFNYNAKNTGTGLKSGAENCQEGVWQQVVITSETASNGTDTDLIMYVNGVSVDTLTVGYIQSGFIDTLKIGYLNQSRYFYGEISQVRIYNRALSATEVKDEYSGKAVLYADIGANETEKGLGDSITDVTGWNLGTNTTHDTSNNQVDYADADISNGGMYKNPGGIVAGKTYLTSYTISNYVDGSVQLSLGGQITGAGTVRSSNGTHVEIITSGASDSLIRLYPATDDTSLSIDSLNITQIGNIAEYLPTSIGATQWLDTSGNGLHGTTSTATQTHPTVFGGDVGACSQCSPFHIGYGCGREQ